MWDAIKTVIKRLLRMLALHCILLMVGYEEAQ